MGWETVPVYSELPMRGDEWKSQEQELWDLNSLIPYLFDKEHNLYLAKLL